jgi:DNA transformation protein and related proteins
MQAPVDAEVRIVQDASMSQELAQLAAELLEPLGAVRVRRMFGGHGLYVDDLFVALIAFDRLFLKADDETRHAFQAAGCEPFVYDGTGKQVTMNYWTVPADAMESPALMQPWARLAVAAALRARAAKPASAKRRPSAAAPASHAKPAKAKASTRRG